MSRRAGHQRKRVVRQTRDSRHLSRRHLPLDSRGSSGQTHQRHLPSLSRSHSLGGAACQQVLKFVQSARDQIPAWRRTSRDVIQHPRLLDSSHSFPHGGALVSSEPRRWEPDPMRHDPIRPPGPLHLHSSPTLPAAFTPAPTHPSTSIPPPTALSPLSPTSDSLAGE